MTILDKDDTPTEDRRKAFVAYKKAVAEHGKPFFPYGVWHDVIAATATLAIIIGLTVVWFAQANCDSWWNVSCNRVSTPLEQEQFTPDDPGAPVVRTESGEVDHDVEVPVLGPLYEEKADPATTSYHPRPEWYFYFLFYLLIVFSHPQLVVVGTIGLATVWLVLLIAWPFLDRRRERRPSRRPIAMSAMVITAAFLLAFTYLGSQAGEDEGGPEGLEPAQVELPGYAVLFEDGVYDTCASCHVLGGIGNSGPGPELTEIGTERELDELVQVLALGAGGGAMPVRGGANISDEELVQVAAFLKTLGDPSLAENPEIADAQPTDFSDLLGGDADESASDDADAVEGTSVGTDEGDDDSAPDSGGTE